MTISSKFSSYWANGFRQEDFYGNVIPTSNQDGHQAKNRKRGDDFFFKSSPLKLRSQSQPSFAEMILG
jgi:hypothetical protein